jgi:methionyl-tRNA synthetase
MRGGLKARCITRDLSWGVSVPKAGFENKVFYVWFDAPIGYISITAASKPDDWQKWWLQTKTGIGADVDAEREDNDYVELVQFMGKDNVLFHTILSPAALIGTGHAWTLPSGISATEHLTFEGAKFSKSNGVGLTGPDAMSSGIPSDVWRFYLISIRPEHADADFRWADMISRVNAELVSNLGNFVNRAIHLAHRFFPSATVPHYSDQISTSDAIVTNATDDLRRKVDEKIAAYARAMDSRCLREGLRLVMAMSSDANKFLQDTAPWAVFKKDEESAIYAVVTALSVTRIIGMLAEPFLPDFARSVDAQIGEPSQLTSKFIMEKNALEAKRLIPGHVLGVPPTPLFRPLSPDSVTDLKARFQCFG